MADNTFFKEAKMGYNKEEVQQFLKRINEEHEFALNAKNDEIKMLVSEKERLEENYTRRIEELCEQLKEKDTESAETAEKYESICLQMGEKLLFAERQSSVIIAAAQEEKARIEQEAKQRAEELVAEIIIKAERGVETALRAAEALRQKSQGISTSLDQMKSIIDEAVVRIGKAAEV